MFLTRCKDASKKNSLYFTSMLVRDIVTSNVERIKIINTGVKAFVKCENKGAECFFRFELPN
jgi:tRNA (cytosine34-C5)-methyltransferase